MVTAVCAYVCQSVAAFPHYCVDPDVSSGMVPSSCALLGEFAIGARVSQHSAECEMSASACTHSACTWLKVAIERLISQESTNKNYTEWHLACKNDLVQLFFPMKSILGDPAQPGKTLEKCNQIKTARGRVV